MSKRQPSDAEILTGLDLDALEVAVTAELARVKLTGSKPDWSLLGAILAECCLDQVNAGGSGEKN